MKVGEPSCPNLFWVWFHLWSTTYIPPFQPTHTDTGISWNIRGIEFLKTQHHTETHPTSTPKIIPFDKFFTPSAHSASPGAHHPIPATAKSNFPSSRRNIH